MTHPRRKRQSPMQQGTYWRWVDCEQGVQYVEIERGIIVDNWARPKEGWYSHPVQEHWIGQPAYKTLRGLGFRPGERRPWHPYWNGG